MSLVSLRGDTAISVYQLKKPADLEISMERGRSMSIFAGSAAKIILAYLPRSRLLKLFGNSPAEIGRRGLGNSWREFSKTLLKIRRDATLLTIGEVNPMSWGISAPIFNADGDVTSSINLIMPSDTYESADRELLKAEVARAARSISAQVAPSEKIAGRAGKPKPQPQRTQT